MKYPSFVTAIKRRRVPSDNVQIRMAVIILQIFPNCVGSGLCVLLLRRYVSEENVAGFADERHMFFHDGGGEMASIFVSLHDFGSVGFSIKQETLDGFSSTGFNDLKQCAISISHASLEDIVFCYGDTV